ncbi:MAG TPA: dTDP-4-dehydrorhamnose reductase [Rubricoccaceae bacterium]|nr:dTDP-4-dehydrorhamnose reductase [Rubricoccaceae bacterium]
MRVLVTGAGGQIGHELVERAPAFGVEATGLGHAALDVADAGAVRRAIGGVEPDVVINAAAYTAVDRAETEPEVAFAINRDGVAALASACAAHGIPLIHFSTDYVFDGTKRTPYTEDDPPNPLGVYGRSKWEGEEAVRAVLDRHVILRTAWVFAGHGHNFVRTMLRLAREREVLRVVADQEGCPTPARGAAEAALTIARQLAEPPARWGTYHVAGTPPTTWHRFAEAIAAEARRHGPLVATHVEPITTADYPTPAPRPAYAVLDTRRTARAFGLTPPAWREALPEVVAALLAGGRP